jgi:predicted NAD/FAD-binding protein
MAHRINPSKVIQRIHYTHPVGSVRAEAAKQRRRELIDHQGISYCGAYWGFGFHEDGARSGEEVANALLAMEPNRVSAHA